MLERLVKRLQDRLRYAQTHCGRCDHPKHSPGKCEALDGGWNPAGYCWCPNSRSPIERSTGKTMRFP